MDGWIQLLFTLRGSFFFSFSDNLKPLIKAALKVTGSDRKLKLSVHLCGSNGLKRPEVDASLQPDPRPKMPSPQRLTKTVPWRMRGGGDSETSNRR